MGRFELPRRARFFAGCPARRRACENDASLRRLQPTLDTSTCTLPDSRSRCFPAMSPRGATSWCPAQSRRRRAARSLRPGKPATGVSSGGASLDGEPPASTSPQPTGAVPGAEAPLPISWIEHRMVLGSLDRGSSMPCFPAHGVFGRAEHAAPLLTSPVATAPFEPGLSTAPTLATARPRRHRAPRQRHATFRNQDAFPRRVPSPPCASPGFGSRLHRNRPRDHRAPATVPGPCHRPASNVCSRAGTDRDEPDPDSRRLDPAPSGEERWTGRLSSTSATRTAREHHHEPSDPRSAPAAVDRPARAGPTGLRPRPPRRPLDPGGADPLLQRDPRGPRKSFASTSTGSSRARGRPAFAHRRLSLCPLP
jgi:hypothetical protein